MPKYVEAFILMDGREGTPADEKRAFELAEEGNREGCFDCKGVLSICYKEACGTLMDLEKAAQLAIASSRQGSPYGDLALASLKFNGLGGVVKNRHEAFTLFKKTADAGIDVGQFMLGVMHENGEDVVKDYVQAFRFFMLAANQGYPSALFKVGDFHHGGFGVPRDIPKAIPWYERAKAAGHRRAAMVLRFLPKE
jgi:TPR repeat protein